VRRKWEMSLTPVPLSQTMIFLPLLSISILKSYVSRISSKEYFSICHNPLDSSHIASSIEWLIPADVYRALPVRNIKVTDVTLDWSYRFVSQSRICAKGSEIQCKKKRKGGEKRVNNQRPRTWIYSARTMNDDGRTSRSEQNRVNSNRKLPSLWETKKDLPRLKQIHQSQSRTRELAERELIARPPFHDSRLWLVDELAAHYAKPMTREFVLKSHQRGQL